MIYGIGIDLVSVKRVKNVYQKFGQKFVDKILTSQEKKDFVTQKIRPENFLAKKFAAKEAFVKALGEGFQKTVFPKDVGTNNDKFGKPILHYSQLVKEMLDKKAIAKLNISIADEIDNAIAIVTLEIN